MRLQFHHELSRVLDVLTAVLALPATLDSTTMRLARSVPLSHILDVVATETTSRLRTSVTVVVFLLSLPS